MKKSQTLKLTGYSCMAGAFLVAPNISDAQVIYTDIDPDFNLTEYGPTPDNYYIDMNEDGFNDFMIHANHVSWSSSGWGADFGSFFIDPLGENQIAYVNGYYSKNCWTTINYFTIKLTEEFIESDTINSAYIFTDANNYIIKWGFDTDPCSIAFNQGGFLEDNMVGVKFYQDGEYHYGWIRLKTSGYEPNNIIIYDFAYNATPDAPIIAGLIPTCFAPAPVGALGVTSTTAKLKWIPEISADHYELQYRIDGGITWTTKIVAGIKNFRKVAGLECNSNYEWRIRTICLAGDTSEYTPIQTFTTAVCKIGNENFIDEENIEIYSYSNQIYVNIDEDIVDPLQLLIFDYLGRKILEKEINDQQNIIELNAADGIYIVKISNGESAVENKIMLQK